MVIGSPPPRRHPGLGVFLASYRNPAVYASRARLSTLATALFTGERGSSFCRMLHIPGPKGWETANRPGLAQELPTRTCSGAA